MKKTLQLIFLINAICLLIFFSAEGKFYIIQDQKGNIIRFTSQNKISSREKALGYILIEKYPATENKDPYGFEKINWKQINLKASEIEDFINSKDKRKPPYPEFKVIATAYTPHERSCYPYADGFTSTQYKAGYQSVAIDPDYGMFSYGDILYIEDYGIGLANDCGSAIKGNRIDVCFNLGDEQKAVDWGKKIVRVWILRKWER